MKPDVDFQLRIAAIARVNELSRQFDDVIPVDALREGFAFDGARISFGSFYSGIFRPKQMRGPAALTLTTSPPKLTRDRPYPDGYDAETDTFVYHYREPQTPSPRAVKAAEADNRALRAAAALATPVIYFVGIGSGQYSAMAPAFVVNDNPIARRVELQKSVMIGDPALAAPATLAAGLPDLDLRRYATREARVRLHQHRFREVVLQAYAGRCAVCSLREADLLQAAHILEDRDPRGSASVVNGIALCAIHHLAYDRNLMGIDPDGCVHISTRLLTEQDGPMLTAGLQNFHGAPIRQPRRRDERPDPDRLHVRFTRFQAAA
jgi:putative restriction endonuclease